MGTATLTNSADVPIHEEPSVEPVAGMRLGRYELQKRIASGGMAQVWSAQQLGEFGFRRACAVKVIRPEYATSSSFRRMFLDEARLAAGIHHPHVVEVFDLGEVGPMVYQAMELVRGCSLAKLIARAGGDESSGSRRGLDAGVVCRIVADMAAGLHAAHELTDDNGNALRIVHRDVSPQNILVSVDGMAKIADFGVAKAFGRLADETDAGQLKGKLSYLSPEQAARQPLDRRSDVFAAGIVMWEALTGRRLFRGEDAVDTLARVRGMPVPDPRELAPDVPAPVADVVLRALERDPARRFPTAAEMSDRVEEAALASKRRIGSKQLAVRVCEVLGLDGPSSTFVSESAPAVARSPAELPEGAEVIASTVVDPPAPAPGRRRALAAAALLGTALVMTGTLARTRPGTPPMAGEPAAPEPLALAAVAAPPVLGTVASAAASASASAPDAAAGEAPSARPRPALHTAGRGGKKAPGTDPKLPFANPY